MILLLSVPVSASEMPDAPAPDLCSDEAARYIELRNIAVSIDLGQLEPPV